MRRGGASFSAPETTRLEAESCAQRSATGSDNFASARLKKYEEPRPPKFLRPIEPSGREIIRSNAPPLCLTDGKIVQLLRRGSASAREESSRKSKSARASGKLAAYGKQTGLIIENLSSGSEGDGCNEVSEGIGKFGGSVATSTKRDETKFGEITNGVAAGPGPREKITDLPISQKIGNRSIDDTDLPISQKIGNRSIGDTDLLDDPESSRSDKKTERTKNHVGKLINCQDNRSSLVPRLDIKSQEYSRGSLVPSRGDSTKRSLDVDQLMRALSDVSIQQQIDRQIAWADRHFPIAASGSRSEQQNENHSSRLGRSKDSIASRNEPSLKEVCAENRVEKMSRKSSISRWNDYVDVPEESSQPLRTGDAWRNRSPDTKKSFGSFDALEKNRPEKPRRSTLKGQVSEPVTSRHRRDVRIISGYSSRRDRTPPIAKRCEESEKPTKTSSTREENRDRGSDRANFDIYEDSPTGNENLSNRTNELSPDGTAGKKNRSTRENHERRRNRKQWKNPASRNLFWADNSSELSRRMASGSSGSPSGDFEKDSYDSGSRSCLVSPGCSLQALSKLSSSGGTTGASRCSSEDSPGGASKKNLGPGELFAADSIDKENESAALTKGEEIPGRVEKVDSPRRVLGRKMEKSESALDAVHRAFESSRRPKVSSSLSRLEASPSDSRGNSSNLGARKKSQERSPFTITGEKSSAPVVRAKRNGKSETTYRLRFDPSPVRLVNGEAEFPTTFEVNEVLSVHPDVPGVGKRRRVVPKIRKFVGKLSRWRRWKSSEDRPNVEEATRVLYENKACRTGAPSSASPSESAAAMRTTERLCSNRDGLWVVGFGDEAEEPEKESPKKSLQDLYEDNEKLEFNAPRNFEEDDKSFQDTGNGCFCAKFCRFLIGGDSHRYTFPSGRSGFPQ